MVVPTWARATAELVQALRPDWTVAAVLSVLENAPRRGGSIGDLAVAAVRAAIDPDTRVPAVIGADGPHWSHVARPVGAREMRCPKPGHGSYPAHNCGACRVDSFGPSEPVLKRLPDAQIRLNAEGVGSVRAILEEGQQP